MMFIKQILQEKGSDVWSLSVGSTVFDALEFMAEKGIGALIVLDDTKIVGIFSERDYARKVILKGKSSKEMLVDEIMTTNVYFVGPDDSIEESMALMTEKHIRHLPVLEEEKLLGVISIGDVVKAIMADKDFTIKQLKSFIAGH